MLSPRTSPQRKDCGTSSHRNGTESFDGEGNRLENTDFFSRQKRVALRNCGRINPEDITEYIAFDGYQALGKVLTEMTPQQVIDVIKDSGLRGRGGAGFLPE